MKSILLRKTNNLKNDCGGKREGGILGRRIYKN